MNNASFQAALITLTLGLGTTGAFAQALPQAGQVGKDMVPSLPPREANPITSPALPSVAATSGVGVNLNVKGFTFAGNTSISTEELQALVAGSLNKSLDFAGLSGVADSVSRYYRGKGYTVARAYLPAQQSANGVIQIAVIEGRYGAINIKNSTSIATERLRRTVLSSLCAGTGADNCMGSKVIDEASLERGVLLLKDLPGITAAASIKPGQAVGTSDLEIETKVTKSKAFSLGFDNYGSPSTGTTRLNGSADFNNLGSGGDQLNIGAATTTSTATKTGSAGYSIPVGYSGQRVGIAFSRSQYRLGAGFDATLSHGTSNALSLFSNYPLIRTANRSMYVRASVETRGAVNSVDLVSSTYKTNANVARIGINGDNVDSLGGGGYTSYGLMASQGFVGTNDASDATSSGAHSAGRFGKIAFNLARQQAVAGALTLYGSLSGQAGNKNLDGSEQTGIGGATSVRGYGGEAGGSTGANSSIELRYTMPMQLGSDTANLTYGTFWDRGWVQYYQTPINATSANTRALSSYGLTVSLQSQAKAPASTAVGYFLRGVYGLHSMSASQQSVVEPTSKSKFWVQGGLTF